jgi:hypothetical protein
MPSVHSRSHGFNGLVLLTLLLCGGWVPVWAAAPDAMAQARAVYAEVNQSEAQLTTRRFAARVRDAAYTREVVAKLDQGQVRKLAVTDLDDSGNVLTDLYFAADGTLVFALRTIQGYKSNGQLETRGENRLYFQQGRLIHMLAGLTKTVIPPHDSLAQAEAATTLTMARALTVAALAPPDRKPTWCTQGETVVFNCHPGKKRVSVCASDGATAKRGSLLYRFGSASGGIPDMLLPATPTAPAGSATGEATGFAGGGGAWLRFTHGNYAYVVYSGIGRWGRNGATEERNGVQVERNGKPLATLSCAESDAGELSPDWFQKMGIKPDAQGFEFPDTSN